MICYNHISCLDIKPTTAPEATAFAISEIADPIRYGKVYDPSSLNIIKDPNNANFGKYSIPYAVSSWWTNITPYTSTKHGISKDIKFVNDVIDFYKDHVTN